MTKWIAALAGVFLGASCGFAAELTSVHPVGFQLIQAPDARGAPLTIGIWYPTSAMAAPRRVGLATVRVASDGPVSGERLPLVIISHGTEGAVGSHADTAMALADAGFVVAAPLHTGDNYADQSAEGGPRWFVERARDVTTTVDYTTQAWAAHAQVDAARIGMFGFSAGGTTVLIAIGGVFDMASLPARCAKVKEFACTLWTAKGETAELTREPRIKAAVIAAPGFGFAFLPDGVKHVSTPVQLWNGDADDRVPAATNGAPLRDALKAEYHIVAGAQHFSFVVPCSGPPICSDTAGFDRVAFHNTMNAEIVRFFREKLK